MGMRSSSLANNPLAITRELDGRYDVVLQVRDNLDLIEQVAGIDFATIITELEAAQEQQAMIDALKARIEILEETGGTK